MDIDVSEARQHWMDTEKRFRRDYKYLSSEYEKWVEKLYQKEEMDEDLVRKEKDCIEKVQRYERLLAMSETEDQRQTFQKIIDDTEGMIVHLRHLAEENEEQYIVRNITHLAKELKQIEKSLEDKNGYFLSTYTCPKHTVMN